MQYRFDNHHDFFEIKVEASGEERHRLMERLQACCDGGARCPMGLDGFEVRQDDETIHLRVTAESGRVVDQAKLERCLCHATAKRG